MKYRKQKRLTKKEAILMLCYALKDRYSLEEIGDVFGVTRQYVSILVIESEKERAIKS